MLNSKNHPLASPWLEQDTNSKPKQANSTPMNLHQLKHPLLFIFFFLSFWSFVLRFGFYRPTNHPSLHKPHRLPRNNNYSPADYQNPELAPSSHPNPRCHDTRLLVYIYDLSPDFNLALLNHCTHLNFRTNMCPHIANHGLGQPMSSPDGSSSFAAATAWSATHQFVAEMLFHARLKNHPCRTLDPTRASLFYVPFYGGLHASSKFREANHTARDALNIRLVEFLQSQPWWRRNQGKDHFLTLGRIARDFERADRGRDYGANRLLHLAPVKNMSVLIIERDPWKGLNQHGIPYPSYFHPSTSGQMVTWQNAMREAKRPYLFSFVGASRSKAVLRSELIRQCNATSRCELLLCARAGTSKCSEPKEVLEVMSRSQFCLQAPGDSFTRRSTFDSLVGGCIPVFFSPHSAYTQYQWYFPVDASTYSVFIEAKKVKGGERSIEEELSKISEERVERMRNCVLSLMPKVTYAHPDATDVDFEDAVDVALKALANNLNSDSKQH